MNNSDRRHFKLEFYIKVLIYLISYYCQLSKAVNLHTSNTLAHISDTRLTQDLTTM